MEDKNQIYLAYLVPNVSKKMYIHLSPINFTNSGSDRSSNRSFLDRQEVSGEAKCFTLLNIKSFYSLKLLRFSPPQQGQGQPLKLSVRKTGRGGGSLCSCHSPQESLSTVICTFHTDDKDTPLIAWSAPPYSSYFWKLETFLFRNLKSKVMRQDVLHFIVR